MDLTVNANGCRYEEFAFKPLMIHAHSQLLACQICFRQIYPVIAPGSSDKVIHGAYWFIEFLQFAE